MKYQYKVYAITFHFLFSLQSSSCLPNSNYNGILHTHNNDNFLYTDSTTMVSVSDEYD